MSGQRYVRGWAVSSGQIGNEWSVLSMQVGNEWATIST